MVAPEWDAARVSVVRRLQSISRGLTPGMETFEIADRAISLALSAHRRDASPELLFRNVWRNARYVHRRRRRRIVLDPFTDDSQFGRKLADGELADGFATPEQQLIAADLAAHIRRAVAGHDRYSGLCFDGLIAGETAKETAQRLRITPRRVKRIRAHIRVVARRYLGE
jgi:hypothetical protein